MTRQDIIDAVLNEFEGLSLTTTLSTGDASQAVDKAVNAIDDAHYTVNPNSTYHPATVRH